MGCVSRKPAKDWSEVAGESRTEWEDGDECASAVAAAVAAGSPTAAAESSSAESESEPESSDTSSVRLTTETAPEKPGAVGEYAVREGGGDGGGEKSPLFHAKVVIVTPKGKDEAPTVLSLRRRS